MAKDDSREKLIKDLLRIGGAVLLAAAFVYLLNTPFMRDLLRLDQPGQDPPMLSFFLVSVVLSLAMVPRTWICVVAGNFYGAVMGSFVSFCSALAAAVIVFVVSRVWLRGPIKRRMPERLRPWYRRLNEDGFRWILFIRIAPIGHAAIANVLGGVSRMSFTAFLGATMIGFLPETIAYATLGSSFDKRSGTQVAIGVGLLVVLFASYRFFPAKLAGRDKAAIQETSGESVPSPAGSG